MKRAYRTTWSGTSSIVAVVTRAQAISKTFASILDAGYKPEWNEIRAVRAPEHDAWAEVDESVACWNEKFLPTPEAKETP